MAIYFEPSSGIGNSTAALIDHAPYADIEQLAAANRKPRRSGRCTARFFRQAEARPQDAIPAGQCPRCGCIAVHATPKDCIDQLRDELAEATGAELRAR
jgi:hypothetical protein